jgi:hypothetical protein
LIKRTALGCLLKAGCDGIVAFETVPLRPPRHAVGAAEDRWRYRGYPMKLFRKEQSLVLRCFAASLLLSSCGGTGPACDSADIRNSVVRIVSDDNNNALAAYAVKNSSSIAALVSNTKSEAEKLGIWEKARQGAVYRLDDTIIVNSTNRAAQEVTCIGLLYVTVEDTTAQKEIQFKVKRAADGKVIVSVNPFLF